ncbi:MAG: sugar phosphate isomerase/epimerase [Planctomycetes bacterium]|nr:sugar phosphate isomerase/epimerase [Planctomycetota bacterium]
MDRRSFVGMTLAGAAGLAAGRQPDARPGQVSPSGNARRASSGPLRIRHAVKIGMIRVGETLSEKFAAAADAGFAGVELDSPGPYTADEVLEAKEETGIEVHGVVLSTHWNKPFNHPDIGVQAEARVALDTALRDCAAFGGTTVLVVPAVVNQSMPYADAYRMSQNAMRGAAGLADELGVSIAIENVWNNFLLSPLEAARYIDELNEPRARRTFGWYFDIGNIVNYGWPEQWIDVLGERILKIDVKEFSRKRRDDEGLWKGFGVEIGEGDVGWDRVRAALRRIGYEGWATAEVGGGGPERLADIARRMNSVFDLA